MIQDQTKISEGIADFLAAVKAHASHQLVGDAQPAEDLLKLARLEVGSIQDGDTPKPLSKMKQNLLTDELGLRSGIFGDEHRDRISLGQTGPKGLLLAMDIVGDQRGRRVQNRLTGTVVLFELDDAGTGEIGFVPEDVLNVGPAESVDGLVFVTDSTEILMPGSQQAYQLVLRRIGVLIFIDQQVLVPLAETVAQLRPLLE